jgi:hypothetical protein
MARKADRKAGSASRRDQQRAAPEIEQEAAQGATASQDQSKADRRDELEARKAEAQSVGQAPDTPGPKRYTDDIAEELLERLALGETLTRICRDERMPSQSTVLLWRRTRRAFAESYAQARADQLRCWADQIVDLADDSAADVLRDLDGRAVLDASGNPIQIKDMPNRTKLKVEARQWLMERLASEEYGLRQQVSMTTTIEAKDDKELLHDLRQTLEDAGISPEALAQMLAGPVQ